MRSVSVPHPVPYQGSKRTLARRILRLFPAKPARLIEPFAGSAAVTLAAAAHGAADEFLLSDILPPLMDLWGMVLRRPEELAADYEGIWRAQFGDPRRHFAGVRDAYNRHGGPARLLYLIARCVKNAVRFNAEGHFNQSADHRRHGMRPDRMRRQILGAHVLLRARCCTECADFRDVLDRAHPGDLVYMDPPYEGVSEGGDPRYASQLPRRELVDALSWLNERGIDWLLSYDGRCGEKVYGARLPESLGLTRVFLPVGRSAQATLNGLASETVESLYLSPGLARSGSVAEGLTIPPKKPCGQLPLLPR
jgi:DNA adenine methylase